MKKWPPEFSTYFNNPTYKAIFVSNIHSNHPGDCSNCGGVGKLFIFVAVAGPFTSPPVSATAHFADGKWWGGSTYSANCPVCRGLGRDASYIDKPYVVPAEWIGERMKKLAETHK